MIMKPACATVVAAIRSGRYPTVLEFGAMLQENGCSQAEARGLVLAYQGAVARRSSAEDQCMAALRSFALRHE
jgi:hypothetical protein